MSSRYSLEKGMEKGMEKGRMEGKIDTARKMLAQGEGPRPDLRAFRGSHGWERVAGRENLPVVISSSRPIESARLGAHSRERAFSSRHRFFFI